MKKHVWVMFALVALIAIPVVAFAGGNHGSKGKSKLDDPGNNASSPTGVRANIKFRDDGTTLTITGKAKGLTAGVPYASLIYDIDSSAEGPFACEPGIFNPSDPNFILPTMFIGFWEVDEKGHGRLSAINIVDDATGARVYVPLSKILTVSIRDLTVENLDPPFFDGSGPAAVVACGWVAVHGGG